MGFDEDSVDAGGGGGFGERGDEFGIAAARCALRPGSLDTVGGIEDDRHAEVAHDLEAAHVDDQIVIAKAGAALGEDDVVVAGRADLLDDVAHVAGGDELALLDVDRFAGAACGEEQVCLAAEEGGNLKDIDGSGGFVGLGGFVDIGENRDALGANRGEDLEAFF